MASEATPDVRQARMKEFMQLLPLIIEIAGLPPSTPDRLFSMDQMEARLLSLRTAYKLARSFIKEVGEAGA
jgi:hypothetical protein